MRCPECGAVVRPEKAQEVYAHPLNPDLIQIYCRPDCVLDALERGYPLKLWNIVLTTDQG